MRKSIRLITCMMAPFVCWTACRPNNSRNRFYAIDNSVRAAINKKTVRYFGEANSNVIFQITSDDGITDSSGLRGIPALAFSMLPDSIIAIECLDTTEEGKGFVLIITKDTVVSRFKISSTRDSMVYRLSPNEALQPELDVPCLKVNITLARQPEFTKGEIIEGKIDLESDSFYKHAGNIDRRMKAKLTAYFKSEPLPLMSKKYKTLRRQ